MLSSKMQLTTQSSPTDTTNVSQTLTRRQMDQLRTNNLLHGNQFEPGTVQFEATHSSAELQQTSSPRGLHSLISRCQDGVLREGGRLTHYPAFFSSVAIPRSNIIWGRNGKTTKKATLSERTSIENRITVFAQINERFAKQNQTIVGVEKDSGLMR